MMYDDDTLKRMSAYPVVHPTELFELNDTVHIKIDVCDHFNDLSISSSMSIKSNKIVIVVVVVVVPYVWAP